MAKKVLLSTSLIPGSTLRPAVKEGLQALTNKDVQLIAEDQRKKVGDSIDLDSATRESYPGSHRWDYLLSVPSTEKLIAVEPHSASDSEIKVVIAKKNNAVALLRSHLEEGKKVSNWIWISHGQVTFSRMERAARILNASGIEFRGRFLRSLD